MSVGSGDFKYDYVDGWAKIPDDWTLAWIGGSAPDSRGRVYCFNRGTHPMVVFDREGNVVDHWGDDLLNHPHGVFMDENEHLWLTDRFAQVVWVYDTSGKLQRHLGFQNVSSRTLPTASGVFNQPTNTWITRDRSIFVTDGYDGSFVHRYAYNGTRELTWGTEGSGPGEFHLPHSVCVIPDDRVVVADRENQRLQLFSRDGEHQETWGGYRSPMDFCVDEDRGVIFVAEGGRRISVVDFEGQVVTQWETLDGSRPFTALPHGIALDDQGALYVVEVQDGSNIHKFVPAG